MLCNEVGEFIWADLLEKVSLDRDRVRLRMEWQCVGEKGSDAPQTGFYLSGKGGERMRNTAEPRNQGFPKPPNSKS